MRPMQDKAVADFRERVDEPDVNGCWPWLGIITDQGYGHLWVGKKRVRAHRFSYELYVGPVPAGLQLDHKCRNRSCVNPQHLEPVTQKENVLRGAGITAANKVKTHCKNGHPFTPENTITFTESYGGIGRECHACKIEKTRRWRARKNAKNVHAD